MCATLLRVKIRVEEKCTVDCDRYGTMKKSHVIGKVDLTLMDPDFARINIKVERDGGMDGTKFRTHPKVEKKEKNLNHGRKMIISPKNKESGFLWEMCLLKWQLRSIVGGPPIKVQFRISERGGATVIGCFYQVQRLLDNMTLKDAILSIP